MDVDTFFNLPVVSKIKFFFFVLFFVVFFKRLLSSFCFHTQFYQFPAMILIMSLENYQCYIFGSEKNFVDAESINVTF